MRTIQAYLPNPRHTEVHRIYVTARPQVAWEAARHFDGGSIPWVRSIFDLRDIGNTIRGKMDNIKDRRIGVDQIASSGKGFRVLEEKPGKEVVIGAVGQFWHLNIPFRDMEPADFRDFDLPGWGKLAWAISVEPYRKGSTINFELRTTATDEASWKSLNRYYHVIGFFSHLIRTSVMSHLQTELGKMKTEDDEDMAYPGDEIIPNAKHQITFHTDIEAPPAIVWDYLMQLGCDRAGWYSIDWLDNRGKASVDHRVKEWKLRSKGDRISATQSQDNFFEVYDVKPREYFVIGGETARMGGPFHMTWAFIIEPIGKDATRLVSRARMVSSPKWAEWLMGNILYPPVHGLMSAAQLKHIKQLSERDAQERPDMPGKVKKAPVKKKHTRRATTA